MKLFFLTQDLCHCLGMRGFIFQIREYYKNVAEF